MTCSISNITLTGLNPVGGGFQTVAISASVTDCDEVIVEIFDGSFPTPSATATVVVSGGVVTTQLTAPNGGMFKCDNNWRVKIVCKNHPRCMAEETLLLACPCCVSYTITPAVGPCLPNATRVVSFDVTFTVTDPNCLPYKVWLDYGDGNVSALHSFFSVGTYAFSATHPLSCLTAQSYVVSVVDSTHPDCTQSSIVLSLDACPWRCCARIVSTTAEVGDCADDCTRKVVLRTDFQPSPPVCLPALLQWSIVDCNGAPVAFSSAAFTTASTSPNFQAPVSLGSAGSPYTATLTQGDPHRCPKQTITFVVPECDVPPKCPDGLALSATDLGCEKDQDGNCTRKLAFQADLTTHCGCGTSAQPTQFTLDFGDGTSTQFAVGVTGPHSLVFEHSYSGPGPVTAVLSSPGCTGTASCTLTAIPQCSPQDCGEPGAPAIECVLCTSCQDYLAKIGASKWHTVLCKTMMALLALCIVAFFVEGASGLNAIDQVNVNEWASHAASITPDSLLFTFSFLGGVGMVALFVLTNLCGNCCLYCALKWGLIVAAVAILVEIVITLFSGVPVNWPWVWLSLAFLVVLYVVNELTVSYWCQQDLDG